MWCRKQSENSISAPYAPCVCVFWWKMLEVLAISKRQETLLCCSLPWFRWIATIYHMCFSHSRFPLWRAFATPNQCSNRSSGSKETFGARHCWPNSGGEYLATIFWIQHVYLSIAPGKHFLDFAKMLSESPFLLQICIAAVQRKVLTK